MTSHHPRSLGILMLDEGLPAGAQETSSRCGSLLNPDTFDVPIVTQVVEKAWATDVIRGEPTLEAAFIAAAQRLVERGAVVLTADCGFSIRYQAAVAEAVDVPTVLSSLLLVPTLLRQIPPSAKLAVVSADARYCGAELVGLSDPIDSARVVIGGIEGGQYLQNALARPPRPTTVPEIEAEVTDCIARLRADDPDIAGILFECTGFPAVTPNVRRAARIPIWDITTLCKMTLASTYGSSTKNRP